MWQDIQPLWVTPCILKLVEKTEEFCCFFFLNSNVKPLIFVQKIIMPKVS